MAWGKMAVGEKTQKEKGLYFDSIDTMRAILTGSKEVMVTKKTSKNQLVLPKGIVKEKQPGNANLATIRAKMEKLGVPPADVNEAVRWARKRK